MNLDGYYASSISKLANHLKVSTSGTKDDKIRRIRETGLTEEKLKELETKLGLKLTKTAKERRSKKLSKKRSSKPELQVVENPDLQKEVENLSQQIEILNKRVEISASTKIDTKIEELTQQMENLNEKPALPGTQEMGTKIEELTAQVQCLEEKTKHAVSTKIGIEFEELGAQIKNLEEKVEASANREIGAKIEAIGQKLTEFESTLTKMLTYTKRLEQTNQSSEKQILYLLNKISDLDLAFEQQLTPEKQDIERTIDKYRDAIMLIVEEKKSLEAHELLDQFSIKPIEERYLERALQDLVSDEFIELKESESKKKLLGRYGRLVLA